MHQSTPMLASAQATKDVLAMAALEVDLSKIEMGQTVTVKWRGKPVFVRRRSEQEVEAANKVGFRVQPATLPDAALPRMHLWLTDNVSLALTQASLLCSQGCAFAVTTKYTNAAQVSLSELRDPEPDSDRATNPEVSPRLIHLRSGLQNSELS
jgi:hypothetical protein